MNKRFYRIVFNKARGMLIVVAETTRSHRAGVSPQSGADARTGSTLTSILAPLAFGFLLAFSCLTPAKAAIVAETMRPAASNRRSPIAPMALRRSIFRHRVAQAFRATSTASLTSMGAAWC